MNNFTPIANLAPAVTNQSSSEKFRKFVEVEVLKIIKLLAEAGNTPKERVQEIARVTLDAVKPDMTLRELYVNAIKLDDAYPELAPVVFHIMKEYEEKYAQKALTEVSALIKSGKYSDAESMVKKILQFKMVN